MSVCYDDGVEIFLCFGVGEKVQRRDGPGTGGRGRDGSDIENLSGILNQVLYVEAVVFYVL